MKRDCYISVDIEADGAIPGVFSMLSLGAAVVGRHHLADDPTACFYIELQPISARFDEAAMKVNQLDRGRLEREGAAPALAMARFEAWVCEAASDAKPVFVGFNATFDWMFVHWYFVHFLGRSPFGIAGLDIKAYAMGSLGLERWSDTTKRNLDRRFLATDVHTHHALDDAREQAEIFSRLRAFTQSQNPSRNR